MLAQGAAKSPDLETLELFCRHALGAVEVERSFHASFGKSLGLTRGQLDEVSKGPMTQAYIGHLQSVARGGTLGEIVAAVLPCYWIYGEVGKRLYKTGRAKPKIFREWIEIYASEEFWRPVREQIQLMDRLGVEGEGQRETTHGGTFHLEQPIRISVLGAGLPVGKLANINFFDSDRFASIPLVVC